MVQIHFWLLVYLQLYSTVVHGDYGQLSLTFLILVRPRSNFLLPSLILSLSLTHTLLLSFASLDCARREQAEASVLVSMVLGVGDLKLARPQTTSAR